MLHDVLIIGAGMAGAMAARALLDQGCRVQLLDKARGAGGRMSTRRIDGLQFDHGAQYFTARDARFRRWVAAWQARGVLERWQPKLVSIDADGIMASKSEPLERFVAIPGQNALLKHVLSDLPVRFGVQASQIARESGFWRVFDATGVQLAQAPQLLLCVPAPQAAALLAEYQSALNFARSAAMQPCWAVMAAFQPALALAFDGAFVNTGALSWIARDSSKPGRSRAMDCWVLHANAAWSAQHLEDSPEQVVAALLAEFARITGIDIAPAYASAHRWRCALGKRDDDIDGHFYDADLQLGIAGDWCAGGRVEGAFLSGQALAGAVMRANSGNAVAQ
jgi:renalase